MVRRARRELTPEERRRRWLRAGLYGCGGCAGAALLLVLTLAALVKSAPPLPPELKEAFRQAATGGSSGMGTIPQAPPPIQPAAPTSAPSPGQATAELPQPPPAPAAQVAPIREQLHALEQARRQGYSGSFQIVISEADLNREIATSGEGAVRNVAVAILDGQVAATGIVDMGPTPVQVLLRGQPTMEGSQPRLVITQAYLGRMPAPGSLVARVQAELDRSVQKAMADSPGATVTGISARRGMIIIEGYLVTATQ